MSVNGAGRLNPMFVSESQWNHVEDKPMSRAPHPPPKKKAAVGYNPQTTGVADIWTADDTMLRITNAGTGSTGASSQLKNSADNSHENYHRIVPISESKCQICGCTSDLELYCVHNEKLTLCDRCRSDIRSIHLKEIKEEREKRNVNEELIHAGPAILILIFLMYLFYEIICFAFEFNVPLYLLQ